MKKILLSFMFFCLSVIVIHAQNLITNGGFETWTNTSAFPESWGASSAAHWGTYYFYVTDGTQGNVLRLADLTSASVAARRFNTTSDFSVLTEGTYRVTFKVKGNVGLRAVVLVKGTAAPSTSTQSATNHFTLINDYPSGTNVANWTTLQYDISVPSTATFGTDYRLHFSWSSSLAAKPVCDFLIDDISLVKYVEAPVTSDKLSKIEITPAGYTPSAGTPDMTLPGFDQDVLQYTFTSSYKNVPVVSATAVDATAEVNIVQATSLTGTQAERTATITVTTTDSKEKNYTVEFIKHSGFMSGISWDTRSVGDYIEWENQTELFSRTSNQSAGNIYAFGNTSARCNSASAGGFHMTTPELVNGASTLSFYLKNTDIAGDNTQVVVKKSTTVAPNWVEIGRVQPNTSEFSNVWKEVALNINDNSAGLKIRFEFEKTIETSGKVFLDDVLIEKATPTISTSANASALAGFNESDVTIATGGHLTIDQNVNYKSLTVQAGAKLTVNNTLTANGGITLESDAIGTATIMDSYETPTINATVKQYVTAGRNWYVSPSVTGAAYSVLNRGASVVEWDETIKDWVTKSSGTLTPGKGYIQVATVAQGSTGTIDFNGLTNSGDIPVSVTRTESGTSRGFNLVGNPYPSYLNWEQVLKLNATNESLLQPSIWYRTATYNNEEGKFDYTFNTYNSTSRVAVPSSTSGYIPPMQAFWVRANSNGTVTFANEMRSHGNGETNLLKVPKADTRKQIRLRVSNSANSTDETLLYFDENALNSFDKYDSEKMFNNVASKPEIFTKAGSERLVINGMNALPLDTELPLGFVTGVAGNFSISPTELTNFDSDTRILLIDKLNPASEFELSDGVSYDFSAPVTTATTDRFSLVFRAPGTTTALNQQVNPHLRVITHAAGEIEIHAPANSQYTVFNAMGQQLAKGITTSGIQSLHLNLASGMYVVKVNNSSKKVIIK